MINGVGNKRQELAETVQRTGAGLPTPTTASVSDGPSKQIKEIEQRISEIKLLTASDTLSEGDRQVRLGEIEFLTGRANMLRERSSIPRA